MEIEQAQVDALHRKQLVIYEEIQRICNANGIKHFAIAGTLLGAVRHKGFIPWDDDLDIGMDRANYRRFLDCASTELRQDFFLQTWHTDPKFGLPMAKVRLNGTRLVESASANVACHQGIFVDIFPFDAKPDAPLRRLAHAVSAYALKRIMLSRSGYIIGNDAPKFVLWAFEGLVRLVNWVPTSRVISIFERQMQQFNNTLSSECVTVAGSYGYRRESIPRQWIENLIPYEFEGYNIPGFLEFDAYLARLYGNYLDIPPVEKRTNRHGIISLSFSTDHGG